MGIGSMILDEARKTKEFKVGHIVRYTAQFLRSTGMVAGAPINGRIEGFKDYGGKMRFPLVLWSDADKPKPVNPKNIELDPRARRINQKIESVEEARRKGGSIELQCMECGKKFKRRLPKSGYTEIKCPKCGSYDIDIAYESEKDTDGPDQDALGEARRFNVGDKVKFKPTMMDRLQGASHGIEPGMSGVVVKGEFGGIYCDPQKKMVSVEWDVKGKKVRWCPTAKSLG